MSQWDNPDHCPSGAVHGPHVWSNGGRVAIPCPGHLRDEPGIPNRNLSSRQFVDIYHGTDIESAQSIQQSGLHPAESSPDVMTVAYDHRTAEDYAHDAADYREGRPAVVHLRVPEEEWHSKYAGHQEDWGYSAAAGLKDTVPAEYVHKVTPLKKRPGSSYH